MWSACSFKLQGIYLSGSLTDKVGVGCSLRKEASPTVNQDFQRGNALDRLTNEERLGLGEKKHFLIY